MPRGPRRKSGSGIYHVLMRGINRQTIFEDGEDSEKFIQTLQKYREICEYRLFAYCLMGNHVHLLLMEVKEPLETVMRKICGSYVLWYNKKYGRAGHLFQDRFKSEPVENDTYFLTVLRYIFQNPVKAGTVNEIQDYMLSNYTDYIQGINNTDTEFVLDIFNSNREKAICEFIEFIKKENKDECLEIKEKLQITDDEAKTIIKDHCNIEHAFDLQKLDIDVRNLYLKDIKEKYGLSIRQIERITGISRGIVQRT